MASIKEIMDRAEAHAVRGERLSKHVTALMIVVLSMCAAFFIATAKHNKHIATIAITLESIFLGLQILIAARVDRHYREADKLIDQAHDFIVASLPDVSEESKL